MTQKLIKVGSSAAVVIPKKSLKDLGLRIGDEVKVEIDTKERTVLIEPAKNTGQEALEWIDSFIRKYRHTLEQLAKK